MTKTNAVPLYYRNQFPLEVIAQAVWLCFRFPLSLRMAEDCLAERGIIVSHQPTRQRARGMKKLKSPGHLQRFLSIRDPIVNLFPPHDMPSIDVREMRSLAMQT